MFEIIKFLVETLLKSISISSILEQKKEKRLNEIGVEIFILYTVLNEIYIVGEKIVVELEESLLWLEEKKKKRETELVKYTKLGYLLPQQAQNINTFVYSLNRLAVKLQVIAPDAYVKAIPLLLHKGNLIRKLLISLRGVDLGVIQRPVFTYFELDAFRGLSSMNIDISQKEKLGYLDFIKLSSSEQSFILAAEAEEKYHKLEVPDISYLDESAYKPISKYLKENQPRKSLEDIKEVLLELRKGLTENFSLQDILLEVGDKRTPIWDPY